MLQSSVQYTRVLQEYQRHKPCATDYVSFLSLFCELFADCMFAERRTGTFQVQPHFMKHETIVSRIPSSFSLFNKETLWLLRCLCLQFLEVTRIFSGLSYGNESGEQSGLILQD